jgi:hypothetical protein
MTSCVAFGIIGICDEPEGTRELNLVVKSFGDALRKYLGGKDWAATRAQLES